MLHLSCNLQTAANWCDFGPGKHCSVFLSYACDRCLIQWIDLAWGETIHPWTFATDQLRYSSNLQSVMTMLQPFLSLSPLTLCSLVSRKHLPWLHLLAIHSSLCGKRWIACSVWDVDRVAKRLANWLVVVQMTSCTLQGIFSFTLFNFTLSLTAQVTLDDFRFLFLLSLSHSYRLHFRWTRDRADSRCFLEVQRRTQSVHSRLFDWNCKWSYRLLARTSWSLVLDLESVYQICNDVSRLIWSQVE